MQKNVNQVLVGLTSCGLAIATNFLPLAHSVSAETLARAQGRCKLTAGTYTVFNGHCVTKQKQQGSTTIFVIELDDGSEYRFRGPSKQALQVETSDGIHNAQFTESPDRGVFAWQEEGENKRLSVKLDTQHPPDVSHDDPAPSLGTALGALAGALIGGLVSGNKPSTLPRTASVNIGGEVPALADLVGARAGQAENALRQRGYVWQNATQQADSAYSNWIESKTGNCVAIRTTDGRYAAILYAPKADCDRPQ